MTIADSWAVQVYETRDGRMLTGARLSATGEAAAHALASDVAELFGGAAVLRITDDPAGATMRAVQIVGMVPAEFVL